MSYQTYKEYLSRIRLAYQSSSKKGKSSILDHAVMVFGRDRKTLIRRLKLDNNTVISPSWLQESPKKRGRPELYPKAIFQPLILDLWLQMGRMSARPMKAAMKDWLPFYRTAGGQPLELSLVEILYSMSTSTLERYIQGARAELRASKGLSTTSRATRLLPQVPIVTLAEQKTERPGYMQADTVAHCGTSAAGLFINSLTLTDLYSSWTVNRALLGKTAIVVREQFVDIHRSLPFTLWAVNTDSGSEFVNHPMIEFMRSPPGLPDEHRTKAIAFTRSRAYKKNDNCYVEQKNFTHVRSLFGYERMDNPHLVAMMNEIYKNYWNPLQNFFIPCMKLKEKLRVGAKIIKRYDEPQTPYQRLMKSTHLTEEQKKALREQKLRMNPFELQSELEAKIKAFFIELKRSNITGAA